MVYTNYSTTAQVRLDDGSVDRPRNCKQPSCGLLRPSRYRRTASFRDDLRFGAGQLQKPPRFVGDLAKIAQALAFANNIEQIAMLADEARRFLNLPRSEPESPPEPSRLPAQTGSPEAARRLFAMSQPVMRTLAETYLHKRGITPLHEDGALRFHPRCYYRPDDYSPTETWPAMIARVTDLDGHITGAHRTWLDPDGFDPVRLGKAPIDTPRRAMGDLLGNAVRFGAANDVLAAGEGIETMLALRCVLPTLPMTAALSANHLAALLLPPTLRRLYIARDNDAAGDGAAMTLTERAHADGIEAIPWSPRRGDFNEDLRAFGLDSLRAVLRVQLAPQDVARFMRQATARTA